MAESGYTAENAKKYQRLKQGISLFYLVWTPFLLGMIAFTPFSLFLDAMAGLFGSNPYLRLAVYFTLFSVIFFFLDLPLAYFSGHELEHRFGLSNQSLAGWASFFLKRALLSFVFSLGLLELLYAVIWHFPKNWWLWAWAGYAAVSYVVGKIFPVWIVPLFYKYDRVADEALKQRIFSLTSRFGLPLENLYSLNLSKTTKKANAAFMGIGKTKRVVLSDTLIHNFTHEEIETVVAHELGHYKHRDILKQLAFGLTGSLAAFYVAFHLLNKLAVQYSYKGAGDIAAMPLLFFIFYLFGLLLTPVQSAFSRWMERAADRFALQAVPRVDVFISCMDKLGKVNFSDPDPHPLYEWFFYDHPSIARRIQMAREWQSRGAA